MKPYHRVKRDEFEKLLEEHVEGLCLAIGRRFAFMKGALWAYDLLTKKEGENNASGSKVPSR